MSSVFLSHNAVDKPFVRRLARDLVLRGIRVWLDEAELLVGDSLLTKIASAIEEMEYLAVILSPNSVGSAWVQRELEIAMSDQLMAKRVKVLPILAADCLLPRFLQDLFYIRMDTDEHYAAGLENLMRRLLPNVPFNPFPDPIVTADRAFDWVRNSSRRAQLSSPEPKVRKKAIEGLDSSALVVPIALGLLADDAQEVAAQAIETLKKLHASEAMMWVGGEDQYIPFGDDVVDGSKIVYYDLNWLLAPIYDYLESNKLPHQIIQKLFVTLEKDSQELRAIALFTLVLARVDEVLPRLISLAITEEDDLIREIAMWGLAEFSWSQSDDVRIKNTLLLGVNDLIGNVRYQAVRGLANYKGQEIVAVAGGMLMDPSSKIVKRAIEILGEQEDRSAFENLSAYLNRPHRRVDEHLRKYAVRALAMHKRPEVEQILIDLLRDGRHSRAFENNNHDAQDVVALALQALDVHGTVACLDVLSSFLNIQTEVNVRSSLQHSSYWPIKIGETASRIMNKVQAPSVRAKTKKRKQTE